jgi:quercetin dioxygenase-like cupin family protein
MSIIELRRFRKLTSFDLGAPTMQKSRTKDRKTTDYRVKNVEPVMIGSDVRARLFTLAPRDVIPWHYHPKTADHYFVLQGELVVSARQPEETQTVGVGRNYRIEPGRPHLIANHAAADCQFLLLQGVGPLDWMKVDG